jgi:hypothetical protein
MGDPIQGSTAYDRGQEGRDMTAHPKPVPPGRPTFQDLASIGATPLARELLAALTASQRSVSELADELIFDLSSVSRCLKAMERRGVIRCWSDGTRHIYEAGPAVVAEHTPDRTVITMTAATGGWLTLVFAGHELRELRRSDPRWHGHEPGVPRVTVVKPAGAHPHSGSAPSPSGPPSAL